MRRRSTSSTSRDALPASRVAISEEHGLPICAEDLLEGRANLIQRAVRSRTLEQSRHCVLGSASGLDERVERGFAPTLIACRAHLGETLPLLAIHVLSHAEQRNRELGLFRHELVDADDDA